MQGHWIGGRGEQVPSCLHLGEPGVRVLFLQFNRIFSDSNMIQQRSCKLYQGGQQTVKTLKNSGFSLPLENAL